jgi:transposase
MNSVTSSATSRSPICSPTRGQPAASTARLAWVCVLQYIEGLSDRQAADAVRGRIDWKYALALELDDPGFHHTALSEFRSRLVEGQAERLLLDTFGKSRQRYVKFRDVSRKPL